MLNKSKEHTKRFVCEKYSEKKAKQSKEGRAREAREKRDERNLHNAYNKQKQVRSSVKNRITIKQEFSQIVAMPLQTVSENLVCYFSDCGEKEMLDIKRNFRMHPQL